MGRDPTPYNSPVTRRRWLIAGVVAVLLAAGAAVLLTRDDGEKATLSAAGLDDCATIEDDTEIRACYAEALKNLVEPASNPTAAVEEITEYARNDLRGFLRPNCHGLMHTVGREYAAEHGVKLATLKDYLPQTSDPGCPAGFAHGLVTGVASQIDLSNPKAAASACEETANRYQRYSCTHGFGHAFMRLTGGKIPESLALCTRLGETMGPDCAQGVFHDYWFAVAGLDDAKAEGELVTDPRRLCGGQPDEYVRQCWYRAFIDNRPPGAIVNGADLIELCPALEGLQLESCITAASVIGPPDPRAQMALCNAFQGKDLLACVRGVKVQNLIDEDPALLLDVIKRCSNFAESVQLGCYRWLGKTLAVLTDGEFQRTGCPKLEGRPAQDACEAGAKEMNGPLVTFS
jgi:hypothetical protein